MESNVGSWWFGASEVQWVRFHSKCVEKPFECCQQGSALVSLWQMDASRQKWNQLNQLTLIPTSWDEGERKWIDPHRYVAEMEVKKIGRRLPKVHIVLSSVTFAPHLETTGPKPHYFHKAFCFICNYSAWCSGSPNESVQLFWAFFWKKNVFHQLTYWETESMDAPK